MRAVFLALVVAIAGFSASLTLSEPAEAAHRGGAALCSGQYLIQHANWQFCWQQDDLRVQGLEINDAQYMGKRVVWKMGVPFSITRYHVPGGVGIGPYKDALGNAGSGQHNGYGLGSTAIDASACPRFLGTGTLINNGRLCLETSEGVNAKVAIWARYNVYNYKFLNGYIFHEDGTVEPRLMFGGYLIDGCSIGSGCVSHFHHGFWRFDFDIMGQANDTVQSFARVEQGTGSGGTLNLVAGPLWTAVPGEAQLVRDYEAFGKWRVIDDKARNENGIPRGYELLPNSLGPGDGVSTGDAFVFAHRTDSTELGYEVPTNPYSDAAYLDRYINGDAVAPGDVVLWYVDHVFHEPRDEERPTMPYHVTGPTLKPRNFSPTNGIEFTGG